LQHEGALAKSQDWRSDGEQMPQLTKRGKWVFGWVVVDKQGNFTIPPEAHREYGFRAGEEVLFLRGSRRSGGFSLGRVEKVPPVLDARALARSRITEKSRVSVPVETGVQPGARLLAVRGSGLALLLLTQGPIYEKALNHPDLEVF
jgi:bifunctional DNA-binding transcriptional regulator/antitoxin component of YhaV-PrlF toxin-antitoxin module